MCGGAATSAVIGTPTMPSHTNCSVFQFMSASLLVGPMIDQLSLNASHSIGLVKTLKVKSTTGFVDLGQGVQNRTVASMANKFEVRCSAEVFDYTERNLPYRLGLEDSNRGLANRYFAIRFVGVPSDASQRPVVIHFPKCEITKSFAISFENSTFANLPFEFEPLVPVPFDPGYSSGLIQRMSVLVSN